jgi:sec-independent protein translocase protein TatA
MFNMGTPEILILGGIVVLLFGGAKVAQLGKGLGEGIREFRSSMAGVTEPTAQEASRKETSDEASKVNAAA